MWRRRSSSLDSWDIAEAMARKALPVLGDYQQVQPREKVSEYKKKRTGGKNKQKIKLYGLGSGPCRVFGQRFPELLHLILKNMMPPHLADCIIFWDEAL